MKRRLFSFLSLFLLIGMNVWAEDVSDLAQTINAAKSGETVQLTADVNLTQTVKINKNLTIDMNGHNITATNCRAFHIVAGDVTFKNSQKETNILGSVVGVNGKISSVKTEGDATFKDNSSVIRVGDNEVDAGTNVKLTIDQYVQVYTKVCYGVTVFGSNTKETLVVNGEVKYDGDAGVPAISGNGSEGYEGTQITIGKTGNVVARNENAIYHPQDGTLNVYGSVGVSYGGGIEAKAGTINILDGAKIFGNKTKVSHEKNSNGCSTKGYAIAVVNNASYGKNQGAKVIIDNPTGCISRNIAIVDDDDDTSNNHGSIVINQGYFEYCDPTSFANGKYVAKGQYSKTPAYWVLDSKDNVVASVNNGTDVWEFGNFAKAVSGWVKGTTLTLNQDVEYATSKTWASGYDMTLDLNGHKWTYTGTTAYAFQVSNGAKFTINDSSTDKTGSIESTNQNATLIVFVGSKNAKEGEIATLVVNGGKIIGKGQAISGNGTYHNTDITINGGELEAKVPVYHPQVGKLTITGGKFTGSEVGVELRSGELNITGGEFSSTATTESVNSNGSGTTTCGYALAIAQHTTKKDIKATISGGTFTGYCGIGVLNPQNNNTQNVNVTISGGKVTATGEKGYALNMTHAGGELVVTGGQFTGAINSVNGTDGKPVTHLLGGSFSTKPADNLLVEGFYVNNVDGEFPCQVEYKEIVAAVDENTTLKGDDDKELSGEDKSAAETAVKETVTENNAVNNSKPNTEDAINNEATTEDDKTLQKIVEEAVTEKNEKPENITTVKTNLSINLKSATVKSESGDKLVTKMVFDIKPVATAFVGDKAVATVTVPNEMIAQKIKFRLPIDSKATSKFARIEHKADNADTADDLGLYAIQKEGNDKYVEIESKNFSEYTATLSNETSTMKAYYGNSTKQEVAMDAATWKKVLAEYPNAIAIVSSENEEFAKGNDVKNVVVEKTVSVSGVDVEVRVCPNFVLTDLKDFYTPVSFTAKTGSYERTSNNYGGEDDMSFNSVCLPFELTSGMLSETAKIYTYAKFDGNTTLGFNITNGMRPGIPCIVRDKNNTAWKVTFNNTVIEKEPGNNSSNMRGTFVNTTQYGKAANEGTTEYYSVNKQNMFQMLANNLSPFRSCLYLHADENIGVTPSKMFKIAIIKDETTGIDSVTDNALTGNGVYTLNGVKVGTNLENLPKGIYIYNGKKIVVK